MIDIRLEYLGNGQFRTANRPSFEAASAKLAQGQRVRAKITKPRSVQQNEFFHALIEAAYENQRAGPVLPTWRHLKSWLLIQAGHCNVKKFAPGAMTPQVAQVLRMEFDTVDFTTDGKSILMKIAKSIRFDKVDGCEFQPIVDRVVEIICAEIVPGLTAEQILNEAKEKASWGFASSSQDQSPNGSGTTNTV